MSDTFELPADDDDRDDMTASDELDDRRRRGRREPKDRDDVAATRRVVEDAVEEAADEAVDETIVEATADDLADAELLEVEEVDDDDEVERAPSRARSTGPAAGTSCTRTPATRTR